MTEPLWLSIARAFVGLHEVVGAGSNPVILQWAKDLGAPSWYDDDEKAWCAIGLNRWLMASQMPIAGSGFELLRAKTFATWGVPLAYAAIGAVMVFERPEGFHVGFCTGERADAYRVLGANQGDAVSEVWISKRRLHAMRWPAMLPLPPKLSWEHPVDGTILSLDEA